MVWRYGLGDRMILDFDKYIVVKSEPELRHILAHLMFAIECLAKNCPRGALDNIKSVEGLVMFDGDTPQDWERYYKNVERRIKLMACKGRKTTKGKSKSKKCKGRTKCKGK